MTDETTTPTPAPEADPVVTPDSVVEPDVPSNSDATVSRVSELNPDQIDAILRDPNVPGDVRAAIVAEYAAQNYLARVEFYADENGVTHTRARQE